MGYALLGGPLRFTVLCFKNSSSSMVRRFISALCVPQLRKKKQIWRYQFKTQKRGRGKIILIMYFTRIE
jgi:hypothetical protein